MKRIKKIHRAISAPIDDLITWRAMPTSSVDHIDPFLFINHHGPQVYPDDNRGLPFGPHPHRGFETLTFIYEGDLMHWDSGGGKSIISAGGIQWMTAGSGLVHAELSSERFKKEGGPLELIQLWFNLPSQLKMTPPKYHGLQKDQLPEIFSEDRKMKIVPVSGSWPGAQGPITAPTGIEIASLYFNEGGNFELDIPEERNILFYVVRGKLEINGNQAGIHDLVEFHPEGSRLSLYAREDSLIILGHGKPYHEPIVAQGPFVMNSAAEIQQAYLDFQNGKLGRWENPD